jgi:glyoxylase-like metal-dependent hydrolase (beta-lactamase superfamily II)
MIPQAAYELVAAAQAVTGHPVTLAVNSHWHGDHVFGNQALPVPCTLISTHRTRALMAERLPRQVEEQRQRGARLLQDLEYQLQREYDPPKRQAITEAIELQRMASDELAGLALRLPDLTFERRVILHGPTRAVDLLTFGTGHTEGDALLYLPGDQIAFVGDLLFNRAHPWLGDGDPDGWLRVYTEIEALDPGVEVVVPGHGAVGGPVDFAALRRYVPALRQIVEEVVRSGGSADDAAVRPVPAAFSDWGAPQVYSANMRYLYAQMAANVT